MKIARSVLLAAILAAAAACTDPGITAPRHSPPAPAYTVVPDTTGVFPAGPTIGSGH